MSADQKPVPQTTDTPTLTASGETVKLPNGGSVFVGYADEEPDLTFMMFINSEGHQTRLILSDEATKALRHMLNDPPTRRGQYVWKAVLEDQTDA